MTWTAHILRTADEISLEQQGPTTSSGTIMVDTCGEADQTAYSVLVKLSESDTALGVRIREGLPLQTYDGAAWVNADSTLWGSEPMLCRRLHVVEHSEKKGLFRVDYETSGFGQPRATISSTDTLLGTDDIQLTTVARPRLANAYRSDPTLPSSETITTSVAPHVFDVDADWHNGVDIGGKKVDVNTSPIPVPIDQTVISISYPIRYPYKTWTGGWDSCRTPPSPNVIGARNAGPMMGYPQGSLLFESIDVQPLHHEYRLVTLTLVYDQWRHAQQIPKTLPQFSTPTFTNETTLAAQTLTVFWQQPHAETFYFDSTTDNYSLQDIINDAGLFSYLEQFEADCGS